MASGGFIQAERTSGADYIEALRNTVRAVWRSACKHDGIDPESKFVVFSTGNPFTSYLSKAQAQLNEAVAGYRAFGYAGMKINASGKAELFKPARKGKRK